jgi:type VI secretion system secreted protein Hcp
MAYEFYISIEGAKQGAFKGGSSDGTAAGGAKRAKGRIGGVKFSFETTSPRDIATGQASGKRTYKPIVITKEWDAASPQIFNALVTNEVLKKVLFEFVKTDAAGKEEIYHTITLTNANVSNLHSYLDLTDTSGDRYDAHELEDVSFVFQKIEIENKEGKTTAADDWRA